jgi:hypothetical protein
MCGFARGRYRRRYRDAESLFIIVLAMIREAIAVLARARRELDTIVNAGGFAHPAQIHTGHDLKPTETHINVPL